MNSWRLDITYHFDGTVTVTTTRFTHRFKSEAVAARFIIWFYARGDAK